MNKNTLTNIILAVASSLFVFVCMLFAYFYFTEDSALRDARVSGSSIDLEYSFTDISSEQATFNIEQQLLGFNPQLSCSGYPKEINISSISTSLPELKEGREYKCELSLDGKNYELHPFTTIASQDASTLKLSGEQYIDDNSGRVVRLNWESSKPVIITVSFLNKNELIDQFELLVEKDNLTERIPAKYDNYDVIYEVRFAGYEEDYTAISFAAGDKGVSKQNKDIQSYRILAKGYAINENAILVENESDYYIAEKVNGILLLTGEFNSNLNPHYVVKSASGKELIRAYDKDSTKYLVSQATLKGKELELTADFLYGDEFFYIDDSGRKIEEKYKSGKIMLDKAYPYILLYNGVDKYIKVSQSSINFDSKWDATLNKITWSEVPGATFYQVKAYDASNSTLLYSATVDAPSHILYNLEYYEEIELKISAASKAGFSFLGSKVVKPDISTSKIAELSLAKLDNTLFISWKSNETLSYLVEISKKGASNWTKLKETGKGAGEVSVENINKLPFGSYSLRISPIKNGKAGSPTLSSCTIDVAGDKTFKIVCE